VFIYVPRGVRIDQPIRVLRYRAEPAWRTSRAC
jgi:hypothetical protein